MRWTGWKTRSIGSLGSLVGFGWFSLIRAENRSPFVFFRFLNLLGRSWKILRASINEMDWLGNQISRFI